MIFHPSLKKLSGYLDHTLGDSYREKVKNHLEKCPPCSKKIQVLEFTGQFLKTPKENIPSLTNRIMEQIGERKIETKKTIVGEIQSIIGSVKINPAHLDKELEAIPGMLLFKNDIVKTEEHSKILIQFQDGSSFYINEKTEMELPAGKYPVHLNIGEFFAMMKPQTDLFQIKTPTAVLAVIGTDFNVKVNGGRKTLLQVLKGKVSYENQSGKTIAKKQQQVEAASFTKPVPVKIKNTNSITDWIQPLNPKPKKGEMKMKKLFIGIIVIAILVGGYYMYQQYSGSSTSSPLTKDVTVKPKALSEPKFMDLGEIKLVGHQMRTTSTKIGDIAPNVWMEYMKRSHEIQNKTNLNSTIGLITFDTTTWQSGDPTMDYFVGSEVANLDNVPPGMTVITLPEQNYAVFEFKGSSNNMSDSYLYIYKTWLPQSGKNLTQPVSFQYYDSRLMQKGPTDPNADIFIYVPVE